DHAAVIGDGSRRLSDATISAFSKTPVRGAGIAQWLSEDDLPVSRYRRVDRDHAGDGSRTFTGIAKEPLEGAPWPLRRSYKSLEAWQHGRRNVFKPAWPVGVGVVKGAIWSP